MSRRRNRGKAAPFGTSKHRKARVQRFNAKHPSRVGRQRGRQADVIPSETRDGDLLIKVVTEPREGRL